MMKKLFGALLLALLFCAGTASAELAVPPQGERIVDLASVLSPAQVKSLYDKLDSLDSATGTQIDILLVPTLGKESIDNYAARVEAVWFPEENAVDKHILFLVSEQERKATLVIGEGLKDAFPTADAKATLSRDVLPKLRSGQVGEGIAAGVDAISTRVEEARVEDVTPPLRTVLIKPISFAQIAYYLLIMAGIFILIFALVYFGKRKDFTEYLNKRRKRFR